MSHVQTERENETLVEAALRVLNTADPFEKARLGDSVASKWLQGTITRPYNPSQDLTVPDRPARLTDVRSNCPRFPHTLTAMEMVQEKDNGFFVFCFKVKLVSPSLMPKLGKAGSLQSRQAIVHSLVHTESWAIDLSWVPFCFYLVVLVYDYGLISLFQAIQS